MYIIEAGAIMALLLGGMCLSVLLMAPLTVAFKHWFCVGPKKLKSTSASTMPAWRLWIHNAGYNASKWIHFVANVALVVCIYWFMGVSVMAHVSVVAFELMWHFVLGPAYAWFLDRKPSSDSRIRKDTGTVLRFACVA